MKLIVDIDEDLYTRLTSDKNKGITTIDVLMIWDALCKGIPLDKMTLEQETQTGHWIKGAGMWICNQCGYEKTFGIATKFCSQCGAKMVDEMR